MGTSGNVNQGGFFWPNGVEVDQSVWRGGEPNDSNGGCACFHNELLKDDICNYGGNEVLCAIKK